MTIIPPKSFQSTSEFFPLETNQKFDWKNCWYPITFIQDLPKNRPYSFSLYDESLVLFRNREGKLACLRDFCPHRAAKLSDGQIVDGKIECLYHGWQFDSNGQCLRIPQLPENARIPAKACVQAFSIAERQGIVWMWAGDSDKIDEQQIPILPDLEKPGFVGTDVVYDLPYDQSYYIENTLDPSHVSVVHTDSHKNDPQPLEMEVLEVSTKGIKGRFRGTKKPDETWRIIDFIAPNLIAFKFNIEERGWSGGFAFYSVPLGKGRCRVLIRSYRNFFTLPIKFKPNWLTHLEQNKIIEEDLALIVGQQKKIERLGLNLKEVYLPLETSDVFVVEYRKWLDKFGADLPFYQGYQSSKLSEKEKDEEVISNRFIRHTQVCNSCNQAYRNTIRLKQISIGIAIAMAALAMVTKSDWTSALATFASVLSIVIAVALNKLQIHFERSSTRH